MKWALLVLAGISLFMCYRVRVLAAEVDVGPGRRNIFGP